MVGFGVGAGAGVDAVPRLPTKYEARRLVALLEWPKKTEVPSFPQ